MKDRFELVVQKDGSIEGIYQDGLAETLDANHAEVCRASNVEWEQNAGWVVRSAKDPLLAIRIDEETEQLIVSRDPKDPLFYFKNREAALEQEVSFFWPLMGRPK